MNKLCPAQLVVDPIGRYKMGPIQDSLAFEVRWRWFSGMCDRPLGHKGKHRCTRPTTGKRIVTILWDVDGSENTQGENS
jgi:hypothetical protein